MSRSFKKHPCVIAATNKEFKKFFNRKTRRRKLEQSGMKSNIHKKENCSYEICDYRCLPNENLNEMTWNDRKYYTMK